ncbi:transcriptional regulator [Rhodobacteraceae bacterium RKSG542]|nr:transcriptional regulator [Pseudovibrio flavus]
MYVFPDKIGKVALMAAMTSKEEEGEFKAWLAQTQEYKIGITVVSGCKSQVSKSFVKSMINCAVQNEVIHHCTGHIHAAIHAGLECLKGLTSDVAAESSLKLKVAVVSDKKWICVVAYGVSAYHPLTNHERVGMGFMHI